MVVIACGCSTISNSAPSIRAGLSPETREATLACLPTFAPGTSEPDSALVGKSLEVAESLASASHQTTRIVAANGTCETITSDLVSNRVDLWIVKGQVIKAVVERSSGTTVASSYEPGQRGITRRSLIRIRADIWRRISGYRVRSETGTFGVRLSAALARIRLKSLRHL
jgi:hypothetical protein